MPITQKIAQNGYSYADYSTLMDTLVAEGKTTGPKQTPALVEFTKLNAHRMNRIVKHTPLLPETVAAMAAMPRHQTWVVLTESWCGDASASVPVLHLMAESGSKVDLRLILRDEHPDIMDAYLTNGARSIPKLIAFDTETWQELFTWGPRPAEAETLRLQIKDTGLDYMAINERIQLWYARDRSVSVQKELVALLQ